MKIAICDDNAELLLEMQKMVSANKLVEKCDTFTNPEYLINRLAERTYDVIMMDIDFSDSDNSGIEYASVICRDHPKLQVIFITAYNDRYSQDIFMRSTNLCGYLVKPIDTKRLNCLLVKANSEMEKRKGRRMVLQIGNAIECIPYENIKYLESNAHKVLIHTEDKIYEVYGKLSDYTKNLSKEFITIHKSFCVNMNKIEKIDGKEILLLSNEILPMSKSKATEVRLIYFRFIREEI